MTHARPRLADAAPPRRVAFLRALQLGDLLCAVPAFRAFRHAWPGAELTLIGLPWAREFVRRLPYLDHFIEFPGLPGLPERTPDAAALPRFFDTVRQAGFDWLIQMQGSGQITNPLVAMLGARRSAGYVRTGDSVGDPTCYLPWREDMPEIRRWLALAQHLGAPACGEALELPILAADRVAFAELKAGLRLRRRPYACLHPGARLATRRWLPERFAAVADALSGAGLGIVLTGTAEEMAIVRGIQRQMHAPAINLAGRTPLGVLAALVSQAELVVCNDTGMSHIAAAVGTPSVVVSSGGDALRWQPLDTTRHRCLWHAVPCRPCPYDICPTGHECAHGVTAEAVIAAALALLSHTRASDHAAS